MKTSREIEKRKTEARDILQRAWSRHARAAKLLTRPQAEEAVERVRKTREQLWEEKLASRS